MRDPTPAAGYCLCALDGLCAQRGVGGVHTISFRARALHSNNRRKSVHEVWLSYGSQTAAICCDRRRWLKGVGRNILNSQYLNSLRELRGFNF